MVCNNNNIEFDMMYIKQKMRNTSRRPCDFVMDGKCKPVRKIIMNISNLAKFRTNKRIARQFIDHTINVMGIWGIYYVVIIF